MERSLEAESVKIGLLVIGNEILDGVIADTNSHWIISQLKAINMRVWEQMTIRDNESEIAKAIRRLISDSCSMIITIGGLGPTYDDKTLKGVAEALNSSLELNPEALSIVTRQYLELYREGKVDTPEIIESRRKMAILPRGAKPLDNKVGGAPGVLLKTKGSVIICLPGVPKEMIWIFENQVKPLLREKTDASYAERIIHIPLKDESILASIIDEVMRRERSVYIKSMVRPHGDPGIKVWISVTGRSEEEAEERLEKASALLAQLSNEIANKKRIATS